MRRATTLPRLARGHFWRITPLTVDGRQEGVRVEIRRRVPLIEQVWDALNYRRVDQSRSIAAGRAVDTPRAIGDAARGILHDWLVACVLEGQRQRRHGDFHGTGGRPVRLREQTPTGALVDLVAMTSAPADAWRRALDLALAERDRTTGGN